MTIDLSNPISFMIAAFFFAVIVWAVGYYIKSIYVDARVEADRRIQQAKDERLKR